MKDRGFFSAVGRRKSDWVRFVVEIVLIVKVLTGDLPATILVALL